ncbi:MAG: FHA domain-containing protein [Hyphomicrobiaceae bacterium]|nr:FHA domain-containing protein [Hyphomicrobiaceae bacterium]
MPIEISWQHAGRRERRALDGRGPFRIGRSTGGDVMLDHPQVSRLHVEITVDGATVLVEDKGSQNGTRIDGQTITGPTPWAVGQTLQVGPFALQYAQIAARPVDEPRPAAGRPAAAPPPERRERPAPAAPEREPLPERTPAGHAGFPGRFFDARTIAMRDIQASGKLEAEIDYAAIGGGCGSFCWVDHLRVYGVKSSQIRVIGVAPDKKPYAKWGRLCRASQIPEHERIRSNSISTPDNIWGFPGYASRECVRDLVAGRLVGLKHVLQVFGEPALTESYTPRLGDVYRSFDVEARRIGWDEMWMHGQVLAIRKTDDERYVVAYRVPNEFAPGQSRDERERFLVARYVQISTGYAASNFLPDLQEFKRNNPDVSAVVNAYEEHDEVYRTLEQKGGTVLIRGRGIVASRVIQRIWEARHKNPNIRILHLNRTAVTQGAKYDLSRRAVRADVQQQPFNWPKACWGGSLRKRLEDAPPEERAKLLAAWGGTTTADRDDWNRIIETGTKEGWYKVFYGTVASMSYQDGHVITRLDGREKFQESLDLTADFVVDCTGLVAQVQEAPLLADLIRTYELPRNKAAGDGPELRLSGIAVTNSFEIAGLQNGRGHVWAAGTVTSNGPYAAVDSFLGLQYAALRSVDQLGHLRAPGVSRFGPLKSFGQWTKWCLGASPG